MKELSIKQKAKRYDEALERAKIYSFDYPIEVVQDTVTDIFPELKENADEKIRKNLITFLKEEYGTNSNARFAGIKVKDVIAWLEKQGEKESDPRYKYLEDLLIADDIYQMAMDSTMVEVAKLKAVNALSKLVIAKLLGIEQPQGKSALEAAKEEKVDNQTCVKPTDKVEPKFHEGDWIIKSDKKFKRSVYLIKEIKDYYVCEYLDGKRIELSFNYVHKNFKLWDISDANDGDVLASELCDSIILFRGVKNNNIDFYCDYDFSKIDIPGDRFAINNGQHYGNLEDSKDFHPATKEQRDLLFLKMKESGYEFDFEKKDLKIIG